MNDFNSVQPDWLDLEIYPSVEAKDLLLRALRLVSNCGEYKKQENQAVLCRLLCELHSDSVLLCAGILFYARLDEKISDEEIKEECSVEVVELFKAFNALSLIDNLLDREKSDIEQLRKMLLAMARDMRAVILKLALQVVVMRQIHRFTPKEQQKRAMQTRDLFAPLANRLGIAQLKWQLEDGALKVLEPDIYQEISQNLEEKRVDRERYIARIISELEYELQNKSIKINRIYGRVKHINSIYLKMKRKRLRFDQLNDIRAVRVEVETEEDCYRALSVVNELWQPVIEEFDDYIAHPKPNGYQSLHSTLIGPENRMLEVQIRTTKMHEKAELGIAAHWKYKEKGVKHSRQFEQQIEWLRRLLDGKGDEKRGDVILDQFRNEAFRDRVYAVSPEGRVIDLPEGATPLDFAYHIHTQIGHRCKGAKINGHLVPLTTALKNGDSVEIITRKEPAPSPDWLAEHLGYLQSGKAKAKVRSYFKKQEREKSIETGREMLAREMKRLDISAANVDFDAVARKFNLINEDDLLTAIGNGGLSVLAVAHEISREQSKHQKKEQTLGERLAEIPVKAAKNSKKQDIEIEGGVDLPINFASCCRPVPPCEVIGFITQGRGINIHRKTCQNAEHLAAKHPERILQAKWNAASQGRYVSDIYVYAYDRVGVLRDISQVIANEKTTISKIDLSHNQRGDLEGKISIEIADVAQLSRIMDRLRQIKDVAEIKRIKA
ncbi:MAG: bifunctional (p)ppGpp synthetase/guanosine-3',5'-bis(diphosphate) 3'-pyrophosphohydrolase [Cardiobacteriaceae bacterium]|nr:bifunctional (p)ppGpp synthetase/guanosine-3',5'-bis(diphosphate) 3'-pyrophosphohydrolase [Cardiobacteriaceae bacterium]